MAGAPHRRTFFRGEVSSFDTLPVLFRLTFVFVALTFTLASARIYDLRIYTLSVLFLVLQGIILIGVTRGWMLDRVRPAFMLADIIVFCAWMWAEPDYAPQLFSLFYLTVPMSAMAYGLRGSMSAAVLAIGAFLFQSAFLSFSLDTPLALLPWQERFAQVWQAMATTHFVPLMLVAIATGVLGDIREREREIRFQRERELLEYRERIELARTVQEFTINTVLPTIPGFEMAASYEPADIAVGGGDYFGVRKLPDGGYALCVADIAGKTISGVAKLPLIRWGFEVVTDMIPDPVKAAARLNRLYCEAIEDDSFITATVAVLRPMTARLTAVSAGQVPPLHYRGRRDTVSWLERGGPALGIVPEAEYEADEVVLEAGDIVVFSSDGLIGATNSQNEELGPDRIIDCIERNKDRPAQELAEALHYLARDFCAAAHHDDFTVLVLRRTVQ